MIFAEALTKLVAGHADRLVLHHHLDEQSGVVSAADIAAFNALVEVAKAALPEDVNAPRAEATA